MTSSELSEFVANALRSEIGNGVRVTARVVSSDNDAVLANQFPADTEVLGIVVRPRTGHDVHILLPVEEKAPPDWYVSIAHGHYKGLTRS